MIKIINTLSILLLIFSFNIATNNCIKQPDFKKFNTNIDLSKFKELSPIEDKKRIDLNENIKKSEIAIKKEDIREPVKDLIKLKDETKPILSDPINEEKCNCHDEYNKPCSFNAKSYFYSKCNMVYFCNVVTFDIYSTEVKVQGYIWSFGDGSTSYEPYPSHFYAEAGDYWVSLTVLTVNKNGDCCSKRYWFKIKVETCNRCEVLKLNNISIEYKGLDTKVLSPTIPHHPLYIYNWEFSDGTKFNTREVYVFNNYSESVKLTVYYASEKNCCHYSIKRRLFIIDYFGEKSLSLYNSDILDASVLSTGNSKENLMSLRSANIYFDKSSDYSKINIKKDNEVKSQLSVAEQIAEQDGIPHEDLKELSEDLPPKEILESFD